MTGMWKVQFKENDKAYNVYLFGDWLTKNDENQPVLSDDGNMLTQWIKQGPGPSADALLSEVQEMKNILSDDTLYLKARLWKALNMLDIMAEMAKINELAYKELGAQEMYRDSVRNGLARLVFRMKENAQAEIENLSVPRTPAEEYRHGYIRGKYEASAMAMQYIQDVIDQAALVVDRNAENEKTEDRE